MRIVLILLAILLNSNLFSQNFYLLSDTSFLHNLTPKNKQKLASLLKEYHNAKTDTHQITILRLIIDEIPIDTIRYSYNNILYNKTKKIIKKYNTKNIKIAYGYSQFYKGENYLYEKQIDSAKEYYQKALKTLSNTNYYSGIGDCYAQLGYIKLIYESNIVKAIENYQKALELYQKNKDTSNIAFALSSLAYLYDVLGIPDSSMSMNLKALKIAEKQKDNKRIAIIYNNLGTLIYDQYSEDSIGTFINQAINYFQKAALYFKLANYTSHISEVYNNIGSIYDNLEQDDSTLYFYKLAFKTAKEHKNLYIQALALQNIGIFFIKYHELDTAEKYFQKAYSLAQKSQNINAIIPILRSLTSLYLDKKEYQKALKYSNRALQLAEKYNNPKYKISIYKILYKLYAHLGDYKNAYNYIKKLLELKEKITSEQIKKTFITKQLQYQYEKEKLLREQEYKKNLTLLNAKKEKARLINVFAITLIILIGIFWAILYNRFKLLKRQNRIINQQKEEILTVQKKLEKRNKTLTDSINYAKHIQQAFMHDFFMYKDLPEHFVLFKPKDIVSGDFFWSKKIDNFWYVAVADCTGHGVPGALLSILGMSYMNEIFALFNQQETLTPSQILELMRERLNKDISHPIESQTLDGIDIILCKINLKTREITFSNANRPLIVIKSNGQVINYKAFRQTIGFNFRVKNFENQRIKLEKNDSLYLFSDGYTDQIGGSQKQLEKFGIQRFINILIKIKDMSAYQQKQILLNQLNNWKNGYTQTDDILIAGIKL